MLTDYKFWFIRRDDNGFITEVAVRFYEGDQVLENGKLAYKRSKRLQTAQDLAHLAQVIDGKTVVVGLKENNGNVAVYYTPTDFGRIKTNKELCLFLNKELLKDPNRMPIPEQLTEGIK